MRRIAPLATTLKREIVRRIRSVSEPRRVIVFGSAARGDMTRDSDIDLLVLADRPAKPLALSASFCDALRGLGRPFDVIVMDEGRYEETKGVFGGLAYPASREGHVLYKAG